MLTPCYTIALISAPKCIPYLTEKHACVVDLPCHSSTAKNRGEERDTKADKHGGGQVDQSEAFDIFFDVDQLFLGVIC